MHHEIVALEKIHQPLPATFDLAAPHTYTLTTYDAPDPSQLRARVQKANILVVTTIKLPADILAPDVSPNLRLVAVMATGTDPVDLEACKKRGVRVVNCPNSNLDAVSEHAIGLYFAARRRTVMLDRMTREVPSVWKTNKTLTGSLRFNDGSPPLCCGDEVMGIVGYGNLGKKIAGLGKALGMQVLVAARKTPAADKGINGVLPPPNSSDRVPFDQVLRRSTVLVVAIPRNPQTMNLISTPEFDAINPHAVIVNIARGGIVNEAALVQAVKEGKIAGAATDVFQTEPAEGPEDSPLLSDDARELNITVSPHLAWFAQRTMTNLGQILKDTVEAWVDGREINVVV